jgi:GDP-L-fucose synthase
MKVYIAGVNGLVGSAVKRRGEELGLEVVGKSSKSLDFRNRNQTFADLVAEKPDLLVIAAATVGGIGANLKSPVSFLSDNLQIELNLIDGANAADVKRLVFLGSSCIYPKYAVQPIKEEFLLTGKLEETNEPYAIAKIGGLKLVQAYRKEYSKKWISLMPPNLYGPNDNFDLEKSHVLPGLIHKFHLAKINDLPSLTLWGDGTPFREFLHVDDLARGIFDLVDLYDDDEPLNIGSGKEISIASLAGKISNIVGFRGSILFNSQMPNGTPRKILDSSRSINYGWTPKVELDAGLKETYSWFLNNYDFAKINV